ncbi:MAG: WG repeat-containing protein [Bacteroidales bacterium]|nr:WG repeat-containing protein [Bacteroidales bacterium]
MKRFLLFIAILFASTAIASAQGAGLSQGQAYKGPSATPQAQVKRCPECGIVKGNVTYPWQHEPWCPYYRSQSSGSSSSHSSTPVSQTTAGLAAGVISSALGAALVSSMSGGGGRDFDFGFNGHQTFRNTNPGGSNGRYVVVRDERTDGVGIYNNSREKWLLRPMKYQALNISDMDAVLAQSYRSDKWGVVDGYSGKVVVPLKYGSAEGAGKGSSPKLLYPETGRKGPCDVLVKTNGGWKLLPERYDEATLVENGRTCVTLKKNGLKGVMGTEGEWLVKPEWLDVIPINDVGGKPAFYVCNKSGWGLMAGGEIVFPNEYRYMRLLGNGHLICCKNGGKYGVCTYDGKYFIQPVFDEISTWKTDLVKNTQFYRIKIDGKYGLYTDDGVLALPPIYTDDKSLERASATCLQDSYSQFIKSKVQHLSVTRGEFEKTSDFEARQKDPVLQQKYMDEHITGAEEEFVQNMLARQKNHRISISDYDADKECFYVNDNATPRSNPYTVRVPVDKAPLFKKEYGQGITGERLAGASYGLRLDTICLNSYVFTLSDGSTFGIEIQ